MKRGFGVVRAAVVLSLVAGVVSAVQLAVSPRVGPASADASTGLAGLFVPAAGRLLDTRNGTGGYSSPMPAQTVRTVTAAGVAGIPATGVSAIALTLTAVGAATIGAISVAPGDVVTPTGTALVFNPGDSVSNTALVALHADGTLRVVADHAVHLIIDVQGYFTSGGSTAPGGFVPVDQTRIGDTRSGLNLPQARVPTGSAITLQAAGLEAGVPADASAVYVNIAVLNQAAIGYLRTYAAGAAVPSTGALDFDDTTQSVSVAVPLSGDGSFSVLVGAGGPVDLIIDIQGYFTPSAAAGVFTPAAVRLLDTRAAPVRTIAGNSVLTLNVAGTAGIPAVAAGLAAVVLNLRTVENSANTTASGYLRLWPSDLAEPATSNLNYTSANTYRSNLAIIAPSADGTISIRNGGPGSIDLVVDVQGWFNLAAPELTSTYYLSGQAIPTAGAAAAANFHWASGNGHLVGFTYSKDGGAPVTVDPSQTALSWYPTTVGPHNLTVRGVLASGRSTPPASFDFSVAPAVAPAVPTSLQIDLGRGDGSLISGVVDGNGSTELTANFYVTDEDGTPLGTDTGPYGSAQITAGQRASLVVPAAAVTAGSTYHWQIEACASGACSARTPAQTFVAGEPAAAPPAAPTISLTISGAGVTGSSAPVSATACGGAPCQPTVDASLRVGDQGDGRLWRSYLRFDTSAVPAGARLTSAVLTLGAAATTGSSAPANVGFAPLASVPAANATGEVLAGLAEVDGAFAASTTTPSADLVSLVQGWLDGDHPNAGVTVEAGGEKAGEGVSYPSPSAASGQPTLTIQYEPPAVAAQPSGLSVRAGDGGLLASWAPPAKAGTSKGVSHYRVTATAGASTVQTTTAASHALLTGLANGSTYTVSVQAVNAVGASAAATGTGAPQAAVAGPHLLACSLTYFEVRDRLHTGGADTAAAALDGASCSAQLAARLNLETPSLLTARQLEILYGHPPSAGGAPQLSGVLALAAPDGGTDVWARVSQSTDDVGSAEAPNFSAQLLLHYAADQTLVSVYSGEAAWQPLVAGADPNGVLASEMAGLAADAASLPAAVTDTAQGIPAAPAGIAQPAYKHTINRYSASVWAVNHYRDPWYNGADNCTDFISRALHFGGGMAYNYHRQPAHTFYWSAMGPVPFGHVIRDDNAWFNGTSGNAIKRRWDGRNWTASYNTAQNLANFLSRNPGRWITSFGAARPGDVVFYAWQPKGGRYRTINHVGIVSWYSAPEWDGEFWTAAQSPNYAYRSIWTSLARLRADSQPGTSPAVYIYRPYGSSK